MIQLRASALRINSKRTREKSQRLHWGEWGGHNMVSPSFLHHKLASQIPPQPISGDRWLGDRIPATPATAAGSQRPGRWWVFCRSPSGNGMVGKFIKSQGWQIEVGKIGGEQTSDATSWTTKQSQLNPTCRLVKNKRVQFNAAIFITTKRQRGPKNGQNQKTSQQSANARSTSTSCSNTKTSNLLQKKRKSIMPQDVIFTTS